MSIDHSCIKGLLFRERRHTHSLAILAQHGERTFQLGDGVEAETAFYGSRVEEILSLHTIRYEEEIVVSVSVFDHGEQLCRCVFHQHFAHLQVKGHNDVGVLG